MGLETTDSHLEKSSDKYVATKPKQKAKSQKSQEREVGSDSRVTTLY